MSMSASLAAIRRGGLRAAASASASPVSVACRGKATLEEPSASAPPKGGVNQLFVPDPYQAPVLEKKANGFDMSHVSAAHWDESWDTARVRETQSDHVVATWGPTSAIKNVPLLERSEGVYLYDRDGKQYLDWTSQAVCTNLGYDVPPAVLEAVQKQLETLPMVYGGLGMTEVRCRMANLMAEILPGDIDGFLFPCGGGEANEAAVRIARRYTGKHKILTQYRSYHGGSTTTLAATGDFRRWFAEAGATGFVKMYNPQPFKFKWAEDAEETTRTALAALEEQILMEGPNTIAAVMLESIVGAGGTLVAPPGYMEGVRALCDKYEILYIADEVMVGFGRTGKLWGFQHYDGLLPDIVTSAKGLSAAYMPLAVVGMRKPIKEFFENNPLGWGATYQAHPVALACAYECVKHLLKEDLVGNAARLEPVMEEEIGRLVEAHPSVRQGRCKGLFGCVDLVDKEGNYIQPLQGPSPDPVMAFRKALAENGIFGLVRPPYLHTAPPLVINEAELRDGFQRVDRALSALDEASGF